MPRRSLLQFTIKYHCRKGIVWRKFFSAPEDAGDTLNLYFWTHRVGEEGAGVFISYDFEPHDHLLKVKHADLVIEEPGLDVLAGQSAARGLAVICFRYCHARGR